MAYKEVVFNTNIYSSAYIQINCCGWQKTVQAGGLTKRPFGRNDYQILYIAKGSMLMEDTEQKEGTVILYKPSEKQIYFATSPETTYYWIHFSGYLADEFFKDYPTKKLNTNYQSAIMNFVENTLSTSLSPNPPTDRYVEAELLCLLNKIIGEKSQNNSAFRAINPAIIYMNENYTQNLSNQEYASMCSMSTFHFIRKFSELVEMPPQKYRMKIVLEKSLELLSESDDKISSISEQLGFSDHVYFSKIFKRRFNMTPSEYRTAVRTSPDVRNTALSNALSNTTAYNNEENECPQVTPLTDTEKTILNYAVNNSASSTQKMAEELNINLRTLQRIISTLKKKELLENRGNRKNIKWKVTYK